MILKISELTVVEFKPFPERWITFTSNLPESEYPKSTGAESSFGSTKKPPSEEKT